MASLRRTVEGWMGDVLYERLGNEPSIDVAWQSIRDLCGQQLFGIEFVPVPFIESGSYFNQLFVFVKKQSVSRKTKHEFNKLSFIIIIIN